MAKSQPAKSQLAIKVNCLISGACAFFRYWLNYPFMRSLSTCRNWASKLSLNLYFWPMGCGILGTFLTAHSKSFLMQRWAHRWQLWKGKQNQLRNNKNVISKDFLLFWPQWSVLVNTIKVFVVNWFQWHYKFWCLFSGALYNGWQIKMCCSNRADKRAPLKR